MTFDQIVDISPRVIQKRLNDLKFLRERPDFHPEPSVFHHIRIVTNRIIEKGYGIDLILTGLLHDICKMDSVKENKKSGYPTSIHHDKDGAELIRKDKSIQEFIQELGGDYERIALICENHMRINTISSMRPAKQEAMKSLPIFEDLQKFHLCDKMTTPEYAMGDVIPSSITVEYKDDGSVEYTTIFKHGIILKKETISRRIFDIYMSLEVATKGKYSYYLDSRSPDFLEIFELIIT